MFWVLLKTLAVLLLGMAVYLFWKYVKAMRKMEFYAKQGVAKLRGSDTFIMGNLWQILQYQKLCRERKAASGKPLDNPIAWLLDQHDPSGAQGSYDTGTIPNIM